MLLQQEVMAARVAQTVQQSIGNSVLRGVQCLLGCFDTRRSESCECSRVMFLASVIFSALRQKRNRSGAGAALMLPA